MTSKNVSNILNKIKNGEITLGYLQYLRRSPPNWQSSLDFNEALKISDVFKKYIVDQDINEDKCSELLFELFALILETRAASKATTVLYERTKSLIFYFLERNLQKNHITNVDIVDLILTHTRLIAESNVLSSLNNYPLKLIETCIKTALTRNEKQNSCLLLLSAYFKYENCLSHIVNKFLENLCDIIQLGKFDKKILIGRKKVSCAAISLAFLTQHTLALNDGAVEAYKTAFTNAAHIADNLWKKCDSNSKESVKYFDFLDSLITDLLIMTDDIYWPAAGFMLKIFGKLFFTSLQPNASPKCKIQVFALKQLSKFAIKIKEKETEFSEAYVQLDLNFSGDVIDGAFLVVCSFLKDAQIGSLPGNVLMVYTNLLRKSPINQTKFHTRRRAEAEAAAFILQSQDYPDFNALVRYVLFYTKSNFKQVQSSAIKHIADFILVEPSIISQPLVKQSLWDWLKTSSAAGREAIAKVIKNFHNSQPEEDFHYIGLLGYLLEDSSVLVRRAAVAAALSLAKNIKRFAEMNHLTCKVLNLVSDADEVVQREVGMFFSVSWLNSTNHVDCLVDICMSPEVAEAISKLLTQFKVATPVACLSQQPMICSNREIFLKERLILLVRSLTPFLREKEVKRRQGAVLALNAVAKVYPETLNQQVLHIINALFDDSQNSSKIRQYLCKILYLLAPYITIQEKKKLCDLINKTIIKTVEDEQLEIPVINLTALLKLLLAVATDDELCRHYRLASWTFLNKFINIDSEENKNKIKKYLSIYIYLSRDYNVTSGTHKLILNYLIRPQYYLTALSALSQSRLEYVPQQNCPFLTKLITRHIEKKKDTAIVIEALNFVSCTLVGYNKMYQKPDMKNVGNSTTEAVSILLQKILPAVLDCVLHTSDDIRKNATRVISYVVQSGLIMMPSLLSHLIAMATDVDKAIKKTACNLISTASENWDLSAHVVDGLSHAYELAKKVTSPNTVIRGFTAVDESSTASVIYNFNKSPGKFQKMVGSILQYAVTADDMWKALYMVDQVLYFPYKMLGEVDFVFKTLTMALSFDSCRNEGFSMYLLRRGVKFLINAYRINGESECVGSPRNSVTRLKLVDDYIDIKIYAAFEINVVGKDVDDDSEMDIPLAELRKKLMVSTIEEDDDSQMEIPLAELRNQLMVSMVRRNEAQQRRCNIKNSTVDATIKERRGVGTRDPPKDPALQYIEENRENAVAQMVPVVERNAARGNLANAVTSSKIKKLTVANSTNKVRPGVISGESSLSKKSAFQPIESGGKLPTVDNRAAHKNLTNAIEKYIIKNSTVVDATNKKKFGASSLLKEAAYQYNEEGREIAAAQVFPNSKVTPWNPAKPQKKVIDAENLEEIYPVQNICDDTMQKLDNEMMETPKNKANGKSSLPINWGASLMKLNIPMIGRKTQPGREAAKSTQNYATQSSKAALNKTYAKNLDSSREENAATLFNKENYINESVGTREDHVQVPLASFTMNRPEPDKTDFIPGSPSFGTPEDMSAVETGSPINRGLVPKQEQPSSDDSNLIPPTLLDEPTYTPPVRVKLEKPHRSFVPSDDSTMPLGGVKREFRNSSDSSDEGSSPFTRSFKPNSGKRLGPTYIFCENDFNRPFKIERKYSNTGFDYKPMRQDDVYDFREDSSPPPKRFKKREIITLD